MFIFIFIFIYYIYCERKTQNEVVISKDDFTTRQMEIVTLPDDFVFLKKK